jgi:hypothetical protein
MSSERHYYLKIGGSDCCVSALSSPHDRCYIMCASELWIMSHLSNKTSISDKIKVNQSMNTDYILSPNNITGGPFNIILFNSIMLLIWYQMKTPNYFLYIPLYLYLIIQYNKMSQFHLIQYYFVPVIHFFFCLLKVIFFKPPFTVD